MTDTLEKILDTLIDPIILMVEKMLPEPTDKQILLLADELAEVLMRLIRLNLQLNTEAQDDSNADVP